MGDGPHRSSFGSLCLGYSIYGCMPYWAGLQLWLACAKSRAGRPPDYLAAVSTDMCKNEDLGRSVTGSSALVQKGCSTH